jgi:hypothetical protein
VNTRTLWILYGASLVAAVALPLATYGQLPDEVVSRFSLSGEPLSTTDKKTVVVLWLAAVLISNMWAPITRIMIRSSPDSVNLPNKTFWLATKARRRFSMEQSERMLALVFLLTNLLLLYVCWHLTWFNLGRISQVPVWPVITGYGLLLASVLWGYHRVFKDVSTWEARELRRVRPVNKS